MGKKMFGLLVRRWLALEVSSNQALEYAIQYIFGWSKH